MQTTSLQHSETVQALGPVVFVDRDSAAGLLIDFLIACEADEPQRDAFLTYARIRAGRQLAAWGVER